MARFGRAYPLPMKRRTAFSSVAYQSTGAGARSATNVSSINWTHTVAADTGLYMIVGVVTSHLGGHWDWPDNYSVKTASSSIDGALTYLGGAGIGISTQTVGGVLLFGRVATAGTHTISVAITSSGNNQAIMGNSVAYSKVGSVGTAVKYEPSGTSGALALAVSSAANNMVVCVAGIDTPGPTPTNLGQTSRYNDGGNITGLGDYGAIADAPGAATVNFTTTSSTHARSAIGLNLKV